MFQSLIFLRKASQNLPSRLSFNRLMGGGPRTFPGGVTKWQWRRMHEKKAREKEKRLLYQEKQLYQARIRSNIRSQIVASADVPSSSISNSHCTHTPLSPRDQITALADRFMKPGAEDLWNEDDGPVTMSVTESSRNKIVGESNDLRKIVQDNPGSSIDVGNLSSLTKSRHFSTSVKGSGMYLKGGNRSLVSMNLMGVMNVRCYSVGTHMQKTPKKVAQEKAKFSRNESSESEDDALGEEERGLRNPVIERKGRYPRFAANESNIFDDDDSDSDLDEKRGRGKRIPTRAALGNCDRKTTKRVPLQFLEKEGDFSNHVEVIRHELNRRRLKGKEGANSELREEELLLSSKRFDECDISPLTVKALTAAGYVQMTRVQEAALTASLEGLDVAVKAKAGPGKSTAFLLPAIETVIKASEKNTKLRIPPVSVLIICPRRELAIQVAAEATALLKYHDDISVQTLIGGTRFKLEQIRFETDRSQILVATPYRLLEHIESKSALSMRLMGLKMLILDEVEKLLDLGLRVPIETIIDCLPRQRRQSLLFSASMTEEVRRICLLVLKRNHTYIDTTTRSGLEINSQVRQAYVVAPHVEHFQIVYKLLEKHISEVADYKVIVYCTTSMMATLMFAFLREMKLCVRELNPKRTQSVQTRIADEFGEWKRLVMITSDILPGGVHYPDVTLVIQVGIPPDREHYIHRLGRTEKGGKAGAGILLLAHWEEYFMDEIRDQLLERTSPPLIETNIKSKMQESMAMIDTSIKESAYVAWLTYYNSIRNIGRDKTTLVESANSFSESIGLKTPPSLLHSTAFRMGLKDIPGIRLKKLQIS